MDRYQQAILEHHQAAAQVLGLSNAIGAALEASFAAQTKDDGTYINYLERAYKIDHEDDGQAYFANHDGDPATYLAEHCPHALRAHELVQERKLAKKRRGMARRRITILGKELAVIAASQQQEG